MLSQVFLILYQFAHFVKIEIMEYLCLNNHSKIKLILFC